jgi:Crinkler effector protein N-terminal domain
MVNLKLFCVIVGEEGDAFSVKIEDSKTVSDLKEAIAVKQKYNFAASKLQLYLAVKDGAWLISKSDEVKELKEGKMTSVVEALTHKNLKLQGEDDLDEVLKGMQEPTSGEIHVLVVLPKQNEQQNDKYVDWKSINHKRHSVDKKVHWRDKDKKCQIVFN